MADIWQRVTEQAADAAASAVYALRTAPEFKTMESEIERAFAASFAIHCILSEMHVVFTIPKKRMPGTVFIVPQYRIGDYRVDFLVGAANEVFALSKAVVVECDGHEWHERAKEQAARDKARDRYLSTQAGKVSRFTGSEIFRDPASCAAEAIKLIGVANGYGVS